MSTRPSAAGSGEKGPGDVLDRLAAVLAARRRERPAGSYVVGLLDGGVDACGAKVTEEAGELVEAAAGGERPAIVHEAADLLFHAMVLLEASGVGFPEVAAELERRFGTGGLEEKASRSGGPR